MKKTLLSLATFAAIGFAGSAQAAKVDICVFDLLGKSGESYQMAQEWALAAKGWGAEINLIPRQDEAVADNDFKAGKCDGVFMTAMRAVNTINLQVRLMRLVAHRAMQLRNVRLPLH
jgi:hypothetical protein